MTKSEEKNIKKRGLIYFFWFALLVFLILAGLNYYFKVKNVETEFFDQKTENVEIKSFVENLVREEADTYLSFIFLTDKKLLEKVHSRYEIVDSIEISKTPNLNMKVSIKKNQQFFNTCVPEELGYLISCMVGNIDGAYYEETEGLKPELLNVEINPKVLYDKNSKERVESPDSLSGNRIYLKEDFAILREIIKWLQGNGFTVKKVHVDELKIVKIYTDNYVLIINLEKGYVDTVKDFELISRTGKLEKFINEDKYLIDYIDLSFKNKVFYKLKTGNASSSINTGSTTATSTATTTSATGTDEFLNYAE